MPLLMFDLDNTLVDRTAAFRSWAAAYAAERGRPGDADWIVTLDADGFAPREQVAAALAERFDEPDETALLARMRSGLVERLALEPDVPAALGSARAAGWRLAIVTNGQAEQQRRKVERVGLADLVDAIVVSGEIGFGKPDPRIFATAAHRAGTTLAGGWMVGDSLAADVAGGRAAGVRTVWLRRGRERADAVAVPDVVADGIGDAVAAVLATQRIS